MTNTIKTGRDGAAALVTIDRAADGNLLTIDMLRELSAALRAASASDAKMIVVRTTGKDFCLGRDPKGNPQAVTALALRQAMIEPILDVYDVLANTPQPIVALVQGGAFGFGCALATACDITIAADNARFKLPEMEKNLPPTLAISAMMARVHRKAVTWMVYSMEEMDAQTALQLGIVSAVVPLGGLEAALAKLKATIEARSMDALVAVKDFMRTAPTMEPRGARDFAANLLAGVLTSAGR